MYSRTVHVQSMCRKILSSRCSSVAQISIAGAVINGHPEPWILQRNMLSCSKAFSTSSPTSSNPPVLHSASDLEFSISFPSHAPAYLKYRYITPTSVNMYTTVVPSTLEGKGVAKLLANAAFDWAVENKLEMKLTCWYLAGYLKRNPRDDVIKLVIS